MHEPDETVMAIWLAVLLHDLAQPLNTAQLLTAQAAAHLEGVHRALHRLTNHTEALRWLVRVLRGDPTAGASLSARTVVDALAAVTSARDNASVDVSAHLAVLAAPGALEVVLSNLLGNARKHAGGAPVSVSAQRTDASASPWPPDSAHTLSGPIVLLTVADAGAGIAGGRRLFEAFSADGGVGLWLCRRIVRAQGGDLWCDPTERGASFTSAWQQAAPHDPGYWPADPVLLGKALRAARTALRLTRAQLSVSSGVADSTIRNIETNRHQPTAATLRALSDALTRAAGPAGVPPFHPPGKKGPSHE